MNTVQRIAKNTGALKGECYTMAEEVSVFEFKPAGGSGVRV